MLLVTLVAAFASTAQELTPIVWHTSVTDNTATGATVKFAVKIDAGWHLYGFDLPEGGPNSTSVTFDIPEGVEAAGEIASSRAPIEKFDPIFELKLSWWENDVCSHAILRYPTEKSIHSVE